MQQSTITIDVGLDANRVPEQISWKATESSADKARKAKAVMLSFWDGADKAALRMDLWTKEMMVDEMGDFYFQTLMTMADTFERATHKKELSADLKKFAESFYNRFREELIKEQGKQP
jgi:gliding motility-associated protein GldC